MKSIRVANTQAENIIRNDFVIHLVPYVFSLKPIKKTISTLLLSSALFLLFSFNTWAVDEAANQQRFIQQQEDLRQQELERQRAERLKPSPQQTIDVEPLEKPPEQTDDNASCYLIKTINIEPNDLFNKAELEKLLPTEESCMTLNDMNTLLHKISQYLYDKGLVTSRAFLPQQDLSDEQLDIVVVIGRIQSYEIPDSLHQREVAMSMPAAEGDVLNLRELEQGIDQLNRLGSHSVELELKPGSEVGQTIVVLKDQARKSYYLSAQRNNYGQRSTGELQNNINVSLLSPFKLADYLSFSAQKDAISDSYKESESFTLSYEMPYGYWTFGFDISYFEYQNPIDFINQKLIASGKSRNQGISASRVFHRDEDSTSQLGVRLQRKETLSFLEDAKLESSSRVLTVAEISLTHDQHIQNGRWRNVLTFQRGLDWFDAEEDPSGLDSDEPRAQFNKWGLRSELTKQISVANMPALWVTRAEVQYSDDKLYGSEQFGVGGQYRVRGYKDSGIAGDKGAFVSSAIIKDLPVNLPVIGQLNANVGLDYGIVDVEDYGFNGTDKMRGWQAGLSNKRGLVDLSLSYAKAIKPLNYIQHNQEEWYFSIGKSY